MLSEDGTISALIFCTKVKETVRGDDVIKSRVQTKVSHVGDHPFLRKLAFANSIKG